jgi:uncharacterized protein
MAEIRRLEPRRRRAPKCPICAAPAVPEHAPFCSPRCRTIDLGRWLGGDYRIPSEDEPDEADLAALAQATEETER